MNQKNNRGVAVLLVVAATVLLLGGVLSYLKISVKKNDQQPQLISQIPDNWLIYRNPVHNYEIKYPPEFHAQTADEPPYPPPPTGMSFSRNWDNSNWCNLEIITFTDADGFKGEINNLRQRKEDIESQAVIGGVSATVFDTQDSEAIHRSYYFDKETRHFRLGYNYNIAGKYSQDCTEIISRMIASFKLN